MPFNMAANTNHTTLSGAPDFVEKLKCHKISPLNVFSLKFGCKIIFFMCSVNFRHQQDSNSLLKEHWSRDLLVQVDYHQFRAIHCDFCATVLNFDDESTGEWNLCHGTRSSVDGPFHGNFRKFLVNGKRPRTLVHSFNSNIVVLPVCYQINFSSRPADKVSGPCQKTFQFGSSVD